MKEAAGRFVVLDSLRGLAALVVFITHAFLLLPQVWDTHFGLGWDSVVFWIDRSPLHLLWAGYEAVILFFALSGFVLGRSYMRSRQAGAGAFIARRIFRIYPAFIFAMLLSGVCAIYFSSDHNPELSRWFNSIVWYNISVPGFLRDFLLIGLSPVSETYDPVVWTLRVEMHLSIAFPVLVWAVEKFSERVVLPLTLILAFLDYRYLNLTSTRYLWIFVIGIAMARRFDRLSAELSRLSKAKIFWMTILALSAYGAREYSTFSHRASEELIMDIAVASGAFLLIFAVLAGALNKMLSARPFLFMGKISYSFYLLHLPVMFAVFHLLYRRDSFLLSAAVSFVLATGAAWFSYQWIEKPGIELGHRVASFFPRNRSAL